MTPPHWKQIETIFFQATQIGGLRDRTEYVQRACAGRRFLRTEVECLLRCHDQGSAGFLSTGFSLAGKMLSHYQVIEEIGRGGIGVVYKAWDKRLRRFVVLKVLPPVLAADPVCRRRFHREAQCACAIRDTHIVPVYDIGHDHGSQFIVMEYVPGKRLDRAIPSHGLPVAACLNYALQIAQALAKAHAAHIIHRDLKPANILVTSDGFVKVLDFGLAKPLVGAWDARASQTQAGTILGTPGYMSPEQARGKKADERSDIFAFGAVLYEMLTGKRAFERESVVETMNAVLKESPPLLPRRVPQNVAFIVRRCLEKEPHRRYQTAEKLLDNLRLLQNSQPTDPSRWRVPCG